MTTLSALWAKSDPFHSLPGHCVDVGQVTLATLRAPAFQRAARQLEAALAHPLEDGLDRWLAYVCALHDLGKCHPYFQGKCPHLCRRLEEAGYPIGSLDDCAGFRHEATSANWIGKKLTASGWQRKDAMVVAHFVRGHHGDFAAPECARPIADNWLELQDELAGALEAIFSPAAWTPEPRSLHRSKASLLLSGLLVFSDWVASNSNLFGLTSENDEDLGSYALRSRMKAEEALEKLKLATLPSSMKIQSFEDVWPGLTPRCLQSACADVLGATAEPGLLIVEAPMGEGKTELAVYAALAMQGNSVAGFYAALPTGATSNQMYNRMGDFLANFAPAYKQSIRLVHGASWLIDRNDELARSGDDDTESLQWAADWFRPKRRALLSPFAVGTVDQAMMAALAVKFGFLRWLGLASRALIIDEVHAYDAYMTCILERLLNWCGCCQIPVVLLSATLPATIRASLEAAYLMTTPEEEAPKEYPLLTFRGLDGSSRFKGNMPCSKRWKLEVELLEGHLGDPEKMAAQAVSLIEQDGVVCVLCNTVTSAQKVFQELRERKPIGCELLLFHARFAAGARRELERTVLDLFDKRSADDYVGQDKRPRPRRAILVATQVVEQSLDLDFDAMLSEVAPIDLLLQRVGRVHRHQRCRPAHMSNPRLLVALPAWAADGHRWGTTGKVYSRFILLKTLSVLRTRTTWRCPDDFRDLIEAVYDDEPQATGIDEVELLAAWAQHREELANMRDAAIKGALLKRPKPANHSFLKDCDDQRREAEEGENSNPLVATTRLGQDRRTIYAIEDTPSHRELIQRKKSPTRKKLEELYLRKVNLPSYWLTDTPEAGFEAPLKAPRWLVFGDVMFLKDSRWVGHNHEGSSFTVREDAVYGFVREASLDRRL